MNLYADSVYPLREDVESSHARQFEQLGLPGTWGTSAQRTAIVYLSKRLPNRIIKAKPSQ
jgi:hypothetical protein